MTTRRQALLVVDAQYDFTEEGSLPVDGGLAVCDRLVDEVRSGDHDVVVATYDWHPADAPFHFAAEGTEPDFADTWPPHCVAGSKGATNPPALADALDDAGARRVYKGQHAAAFSGFEGHEAPDGSGASLAELLEREGVTDVVIGGLALEFCVAATTRDALSWAAERPGRRVVVRRELTEPVVPAAADAVLTELSDLGARIEGTGIDGGATHGATAG